MVDFVDSEYPWFCPDGPTGEPEGFNFPATEVAFVESAFRETAMFLTMCKACGEEFNAPGNCPQCGAAFHY